MLMVVCQEAYQQDISSNKQDIKKTKRRNTKQIQYQLRTCLPVVNSGDKPVPRVARAAPPLEVVHQRVQELLQMGLVATRLEDGAQRVRKHGHLRRIW